MTPRESNVLEAALPSKNSRLSIIQPYLEVLVIQIQCLFLVEMV
jgi:hypothetical protein